MKKFTNRTYTVVLHSTPERHEQVTAAKSQIYAGILELTDERGRRVAAFAPGAWERFTAEVPATVGTDKPA